MYVKLLIACMFAATLTACAVSNDPRQGGFFGGLHGLFTDSYDNRIYQRKDELTRQNSINNELKEQSKQLEGEAQAKETELQSEQHRMADLDEALSNLESNVEQLHAKSEKQKTEIAALRHKIKKQRQRIKSQQAALNDMARTGGISANADRMRVLEKERNRLGDEYKKLVEYSKALSDATN